MGKVRVFVVVYLAMAAMTVFAFLFPAEAEGERLLFEEEKISVNEDNNITPHGENFDIVEPIGEEGQWTLSYYAPSALMIQRDIRFPAVYEGHHVVRAELSIGGSRVLGPEDGPVLGVETITFEEGIQELDDFSATFACVCLQKVVIPKSMKKFPDNAFEGSKKHVVLYVYAGSEGEKFAKRNGYQYQIREEKG